MLDMLILALGTPLGLTVTIPPEFGVVLPLLAACSTSSFTVGPNTSDFALCSPPCHGDPPVERSWTPVPHRGVTFSSSCRSAFFILKQEMIDILLHFFIHSMSTLLLHFCYFSIVLLKSSSSDALTRVSFSKCPRQRFLWRAALLKTDEPSRLSCNRRTSQLLLNLFCWIVIKDVQVHTQRMSVIPGLWRLLCWHLFLLPEGLLFPEGLVV